MHGSPGRPRPRSTTAARVTFLFGALGATCLGEAVAAAASATPATPAALSAPSAPAAPSRSTAAAAIPASASITATASTGSAGIAATSDSAGSPVAAIAAGGPEPMPDERMGLAEAVRRALQRNPTAMVAAEEIERTEAVLREVRAGSLPTLTANGTYTRLDADRRFGANVILAANQLSANLLLTVPIIAPQQWVQWRHATDSLDVARATAADVRRQVALATARAFLSVISQERVVEVDQRAVKTAQAHYDFAKTRFAGGVGNRIDEVRARQELLSDTAQLAAAYAGLTRVREALGVLVGAKGAVDAVGEPTFVSPPSVAAALSEATSSRLDVRAASRRAEAADRVARDSWADYAPLLVGEFQPFYQNPPSLTQPQTGWQAFLILSLPLYDGGARYGRRDERRALASEARAELDATLRQARSEVRVAFETVRQADQGLSAARDAAEAAHQALDLATLAYKAGATTNLEVIDAERRALDADTAATIAEDGARQARLDLLAASGRFP